MRDADASSRVEFVDWDGNPIVVAYMSHLPEKGTNVYVNGKKHEVWSIEYLLDTQNDKGERIRVEARVTVRITILDKIPF